MTEIFVFIAKSIAIVSGIGLLGCIVFLIYLHGQDIEHGFEDDDNE